MVLRGVVFDFDGTLADTLPIVFKTFRSVLMPRLGREISNDELRHYFGPSEEGILQRLVPDQPAISIEAYLDLYERLHFSYPVAIPGVRQMLELLSSMGLQMAIVTGKGQRSADISIRYLALADYFAFVETGNPSYGNKEVPIRRVLNSWHFAPHQVIYVGDMAEDMRNAVAVGLIPVGAAWLKSTRPEILRNAGAMKVFSDPLAFALWVGSLF